VSASDASQQANRSGMDPTRLVVISYLVFALILTLFFDHLLELLFARVGVRNPEIVDGLGWRVSTLIGVLLAFGGAIFGWVNPKTKTLSLEVANELMRVTWPSWEETRVSTMAVVVASVIAAAVLFGIDTLSYKLMVDWLPALWGKL
jgi:preprotein translocase subunit SecE